MQVNSKPLVEQSVLGSFVKKLSISVAEFEVILVSREIKTIRTTLCLKIRLLCYLLLLI